MSGIKHNISPVLSLAVTPLVIELLDTNLDAVDKQLYQLIFAPVMSFRSPLDLYMPQCICSNVVSGSLFGGWDHYGQAFEYFVWMSRFLSRVAGSM